MKRTFLDELTPEMIQDNPFPVKEVLENSIYYPASGFDGGLIRDCNVNRRNWGVNSFVYVDYHETEQRLQETTKPRGYRLLGKRRLKEEELVPNGWRPQLPPNIDMRKYQDTVCSFANKRPFGTWLVFEREEGFGEEHGPERFSLFYLCADGVAAYQALYWSNNCVPKAIAIIQPGTGFGFNWTDFFRKGDPFYWTVKNNPAGMPEYVYCGYWARTATSANASPEHFHFDWPEYQFVFPAVGYPDHEVIVYHNGQKPFLAI